MSELENNLKNQIQRTRTNDLAMIEACINNAKDHLEMYKKTKDDYHIEPIRTFIARAEVRILKVMESLKN